MFNKLKINYSRFKELYPDLSYVPFDSRASSETEFREKFLTSKLWRMNNLYTIVDKEGNRIPFVMNAAQHLVYAKFRIHPRLIILKSRQQGISTFWLIFFFDSAVFGDDLNIGLMAQGKAEASTLLKRVKTAWDELKPSIKGFLNIELGRNNTEEFSFSNGSTIYIRTSFRSATLQGLHVSEYGKIANKYPEKARETKTGTMQAIKGGLPVAIESTAEGKNDFKRMWDKAEDLQIRGMELSGKDFYPVFLSWLDDPDCVTSIEQPIDQTTAEYFKKLEDETGRTLTNKQKWYWVSQYRELGDDVYQEYPATPDEAFMATKDGTYYAKLYRRHIQQKRRVIKKLYDENLPVHIAMDLGMNDTFVLTYFQQWRKEWRIVGEYRNSGEGLAHYVEQIKDSEFKQIGTVYLPHDVKVRELSTGQSRLHRLRQLGLRNYKVLPRIAVADGIEAVRRIIPDLWIDETCTYLIDCILNYSKEWDDKLEVWKNKPLHNEFSNGADSIRYMAVGGTSNLMATINASKQGREHNEGDNDSVVDGLAL